VRLSHRFRTSTSPTSRIAIRTTAIVAALTTVLTAGGIAITASTSAHAEQPVVAAAKTPTNAISLINVTAFNVSINRGLAASQHAQALQAAAVRTQIVTFAKAQIGDRYVAGASGPNRFDCSGLTRYVYKSVVGKTLPHQSHAQYSTVKRISKSQARPGDLVFFFRHGAHHVGIYIGGNKMVDAVGYGSGVRISPISGSWWSSTYSGMGRVLSA